MLSIKTKLYTILVLGILIIIGIIYLIFNKPESKEVVVTVEPTFTTEVVETIVPTETPVIEEIVDTTTDSSINKIVNKENMVSESYVPELVSLNVANENDQKLRPEAASALEEMFNAASAEGINLNVVSGYRSYSEQRSLWYTYEEKYGRKYANRLDATPGASEHQLGLAVDLSANVGCKLKQCFGTTTAGKWLAENSYKFGFILRYPDGKEDITGVIYSPWHFRYIGVKEATKIYESGLTLEEFYNK